MTDESGIEFTQNEYTKLQNFFTNNSSQFVLAIKDRILTLVSNRVKVQRRIVNVGNYRYRCFNGLMQSADLNKENWRYLDGVNPNEYLIIQAISEIQSKGEFLTDAEIAAQASQPTP